MTLPAPYYQDAAVTLYHADAREIVPLVTADVLLTDPPWITSTKGIEIIGHGVAPRRQKSTSLTYGMVGLFDADLLTMAVKRVRYDRLVLCGYKELGEVCRMSSPIRGVFVWHKPNAALARVYPAKPDVSFIVWSGEKSLLYGHQHWPSMVFSVPFPQAGCMAQERFVDGTGKARHPCQGPVALYRSLLKPFKGRCILDPFCGTGTALRAAKDCGLTVIGIEIEERWCEMAAKRLSQGVLTFG